MDDEIIDGMTPIDFIVTYDIIDDKVDSFLPRDRRFLILRAPSPCGRARRRMPRLIREEADAAH